MGDEPEPEVARRGRVGPVGIATALVGVFQAACFFGIGVMEHPLNFDEGAYLSAAELLVHGNVMYRDYIAVHPPMLFYLLLPSTLFGPQLAFGIGRCLVFSIGLLGLWLVGRLAARHTSPWPAVAAVVGYGLTASVVVANRNMVTEPLVNLFALTTAWCWLDPGPPLAPPDDGDGQGTDLEAADRRRSWRTGVAFGLACATKLVAPLLVVPMLATAPRGARVRTVGRVVLVGLAAFAVVTLPMAVRAPGGFVEQVLWFQVARPPAQVPLLSLERLARLVPGTVALDNVGFLLFPVAALAAAVAAMLDRGVRDRYGRFVVTWFASVALALYLGRDHDPQYNAHLAAPAALLLAWGVHRSLAWARQVQPGHPTAVRVARALGVLLLVAAAATMVRMDRAVALGRDQTAAEIGGFVKGHRGCILSFEAGWLLVGDRLPDPDQSGRLVTDPFVAGLIEAVRSGRGDEGFDAPATQALFRRALATCPTVIVGPRGRWHLSWAWPWFESHYHRTFTTSTGVDVWVRDGASDPGG